MTTPHTLAALLTQARDAMRRRHLSLRTEEAYLARIKQFVLCHGRRNPQNLGAPEVAAFLTHLAVVDQVAASTQNIALSAILFLYRDVLNIELPPLPGLEYARRTGHVPTVFSRAEVRALLAHLEGESHLMASPLYGAGLRLMECIRLRVKDVDLGRGEIVIRDGKGARDRVTVLPQSLHDALARQLARTRLQFEDGLAAGNANTSLPDALARKYPHAGREWAWQYVFPAARPSADPRTGSVRRHHVGEHVLQRAVKEAIRKAGIAKVYPLKEGATVHFLPGVFGAEDTLQQYRNSWDTRTCGRP